MDEGVQAGAGQGSEQRLVAGVREAEKHPGEVQQGFVGEEHGTYEEDCQHQGEETGQTHHGQVFIFISKIEWNYYTLLY